MPVFKGLETKFNEVAAEYEKWRPAYVPQLYEDIFGAKKINNSSRVLEIGIGTGQATLPILMTNCRLTAIDIGNNLAACSKRKFKDYDNFKIENISFQDYESPDNSFDLIYSASAFHWIPEETGYPKVYKLLKNDGIFAQFANHPYYGNKENESLNIAMQKVYAAYMPNSIAENEFSEEQCKKRADTLRKYGFHDVFYKMYRRTRTFSAKGYISLIGTYSDHRALPNEQREVFLNEIRERINDFGGKITIRDTIDLQCGRKA